MKFFSLGRRFKNLLHAKEKSCVDECVRFTFINCSSFLYYVFFYNNVLHEKSKAMLQDVWKKKKIK